MSLRPLFHQKTERVEAHILVCFLSLALWRTLEMWMRGKGLGTCARQLIKEVATVRSMDVVFQCVNSTGCQSREFVYALSHVLIALWRNSCSAWD